MSLSLALIGQTPAERILSLKNKRHKDKLLIHEIFASIQGESTFAGRPCVFVRTTGCHLRCRYCDTAHAFFDGSEMSLDAILEKVASYNIGLVEVTGGEPLLQPKSLDLLTQLCDHGFEVLLETSGAVSIDRVDRRVRVILDVKTPASGEAHRNYWPNLKNLWPGCEVKFVICDRADFEFARELVVKHELDKKHPVLFSPESETMDPKKLSKWIVEEALPVRYQMQLHKVIWGDISGV